ncbi:MAG TPA: DUF4177 domain-containing protein [Clostridia bacterium]|nr:DUF4177 domain-containing protein [Clostridia bacterium]
MDTWEYRTIQLEAKGFMGGIVDMSTFQNELNDLGRDGWELVTCFDTNMSYGQTRYIIGVFKRKCQF